MVLPWSCLNFERYLQDPAKLNQAWSYHDPAFCNNLAYSGSWKIFKEHAMIVPWPCKISYHLCKILYELGMISLWSHYVLMILPWYFHGLPIVMVSDRMAEVLTPEIYRAYWSIFLSGTVLLLTTIIVQMDKSYNLHSAWLIRDEFPVLHYRLQ